MTLELLAAMKDGGLGAAEAALLSHLMGASDALRQDDLVTVHIAFGRGRLEVDFYRDGFDTKKAISTPIQTTGLTCRTHGGDHR